VIVIGASLGGAHAAQTLFAQLPEAIALPIALVLHRHRDSGAGLVDFLQRESRLRIVEAVDKQRIEAGVVYLAPADYHLLIDGDRLALSVDEPVRYARPSVDVLFESAAATCREKAIAVVLTGGGADGALGVAAIDACGGKVLVQDPSTAVSGEMPSAAIRAAKNAEVLELASLAPRLAQLAK
jgi:two-component system chemotaxis response regulator CheB